MKACFAPALSAENSSCDMDFSASPPLAEGAGSAAAGKPRDSEERGKGTELGIEGGDLRGGRDKRGIAGGNIRPGLITLGGDRGHLGAGLSEVGTDSALAAQGRETGGDEGSECGGSRDDRRGGRGDIIRVLAGVGMLGGESGE